jgi:hypothetical protein
LGLHLKRTHATQQPRAPLRWSSREAQFQYEIQQSQPIYEVQQAVEFNFIPHIDPGWTIDGNKEMPSSGLRNLPKASDSTASSDTESEDNVSDTSYVDAEPEEEKPIGKVVKGYAGIERRLPTVSGFKFHFLDGFVCHSHDNFHVDPNSPLFIKIHDCRVLSVLGQLYWPGIGIICLLHTVKHILPINHWVTHMQKLHHTKYSGYSLAHLQTMADHVASTHLLSTTELPHEISSPIPIMDSLPVIHHQCPVPRCDKWFSGKQAKYNTDRHIRDNHDTFQTQSSYMQRYAQKLYVYRYPQVVLHTFALPKDWAGVIYHPPVQYPIATEPQADTAPAQAKYLREAGWPTYIRSLHASPRKLVRLVEIPHKGLATHKKRREEQWIENGLHICHKANLVYVKSAMDFAFGKHHNLRKLLVQG